MNYVLKNKEEVKRLKTQSELPQYSMDREFKDIFFKEGSELLEIGCGGGDVIEFINENYTIKASACDLLSEHIDHCKKTRSKEIDFFQFNILDRPTDKKYDYIVLRYVAQHIGEELFNQAVKNIKKSLKENGEIIIIDVDGLMNSLHCSNTFVLNSIQKISNNFQGDFNIGRKLRGILTKNNLKVDVFTWVDNFETSEDKFSESIQWEKRIDFCRELIIKSLGSELDFHRFKKEFLAEIIKEESSYYLVKFVYRAISE